MYSAMAIRNASTASIMPTAKSFAALGDTAPTRRPSVSDAPITVAS